MRYFAFYDGTQNGHSTARQPNRDHHAPTHLWRRTLPFQVGGYFGNCMWFIKKKIEMQRLGTTRLTCISPKEHPTKKIFGWRHTFCDQPQPHHGHPHQSPRLCRCLYWQYKGTNSQPAQYQLEAAISLAIEVAAQPNDANKPIPHKKMITKEKLTAEGGLSETKTIFGWHFNFRTLTVTLPEHKHIAWSR